MNKYRLFIDPEKEEIWINKIQQDGYRLVSNTLDFIYTFEETDEKYITRTDYQNHMSKEKYDEYLNIHEEFGWEHIRGGRFGMTQQIWSKIEDGNDTLFSDRDSKINFYKRQMNFTGSLAFLFLIYSFIFEPVTGNNLFLTSGLWDMQGTEFWRAFLFELPFAIMRFLPAILFPIAAVLFFVSYYKLDQAKKALEKEK
ncbi:Protein of unknown function [Jeotgalicoccus aerolatus]|uniref:DUF2812 domain-containing protein n=1 Tax=Jeotgalicoccus aerolatus TaxID=709510 RepID=A0A1G8Y9X3_9STAP|nr:DUF2812 domain-containing protein [Jeotgalicoccus aerolatus]NMA81907.1 DUF2812 domain-containing protein [Jeotgalicoccus aerolatus]SDJ99483.1 Protein of unknown function [Jeotgalicoccus aerolatus]